jgi:hypothetical protein
MSSTLDFYLAVDLSLASPAEIFTHHVHLPPMSPQVILERAPGIIRTGQFGSLVVCDPVPPGADEDWLLQIDPHQANALEQYLIQAGFDYISEYPMRYFASLKSYVHNPVLNFTVTTSEEQFDRCMLATRICKSLNLQNKADRIAVHEAIEYGRLSPNDPIRPLP